MALIQLMGDTKTRTFTKILIVLVVAALLSSTGFVVGYLKGASSCKTINVSNAKKSLKYSQSASGATAKYNLEQQKKTAEVQQQINEVIHECLPTPMPTDLIDALNQ